MRLGRGKSVPQFHLQTWWDRDSGNELDVGGAHSDKGRLHGPAAAARRQSQGQVLGLGEPVSGAAMRHSSSGASTPPPSQGQCQCVLRQTSVPAPNHRSRSESHLSPPCAHTCLTGSSLPQAIRHTFPSPQGAQGLLCP